MLSAPDTLASCHFLKKFFKIYIFTIDTVSICMCIDCYEIVCDKVTAFQTLSSKSFTITQH